MQGLIRSLATLGLSAALAVSLPGCETRDMSGKQMGGALIGAALGGLLGAQFGGGAGKVAAAALGVAVGGFLGSEVGKSLDRADQAYHDKAAEKALWESPTGTTSRWRNPDSGNGGTVTPTADAYRTDGGRACRRFSDTVTFADGTRDTVTGTACRNPDGSWQIMD